MGGASRPRPDLSFRGDNQYKRVHQSSLRFILRGEFEKTEEFLTQFLEEHPRDAETLYMLGILFAQRGQLAEADRRFRAAIDAGLPDSRLVAGPRSLMQPVESSELFAALHQKYAQIPVQGPLVGQVTDDSASVWVKTADECNVRLHVVEAGGRPSAGDIRSGSPVKSLAGEDFTAVATISGLQANTDYQYAISLDGGEIRFLTGQRFRTFGPSGAPTRFKLAFGGGAGYVPENERMWTTIERTEPDAMLLLGDNVYIDDPESIEMQQYTYQRRQSRPEWRALTAHTPVYTIWDDHDFSTNDSWGGPDIDVPFWKSEWVYPIFRQNWANPGYGGGNSQPGCWYSFQIGDVDFVMLDCRYYRSTPRRPEPTMLGPVQLAWLKEELRACQGTFKVICSSVPWDYRTKGDSLDTWNGFQQEREEILGFIESEKIDGVLLMSADRHRSDAWRIDRDNGYSFYEFNSSRLTNQHVHPTMEKAGAIFSYNKPQSFGLVEFDTGLEDPQVTYTVVNIDGDRPHTLTVRRSELQSRESN